MKNLPLGVQNFREIIEKNHVYVDKTMYIHQLITSGKCFFLSRPRRFGKSLFLDTIAEVFKGNRELFKGLWIYDSGYDFKPHPIIKLDMSNVTTLSTEAFVKSLTARLLCNAKEGNVDVYEETPTGLLNDLIRGLQLKYNQQIVVLIDEYDKPILDHVTDIKIAESNRNIVRDLYGLLKSLDSYIKFTFFTGVSKFTKTSVFSSLNNLSDITMNKNYANVCGIPVNDLELYFGERIKILSQHENFIESPSLTDLILKWYDGYSWDGKTRLLNPFGLLSFFYAEELKSFWYVSGSPKFLIDLIKENPYCVPSLGNIKMLERSLDAIDIGSLEISALLFQTGYLTVSKVIPAIAETGTPTSYLLDIPNFEVRDAFFSQLLASFTENDYFFTDNAYFDMKEALRNGDLQTVLVKLKSLFASIPYQLHVEKEAYYHSIFFCLMNVLGFKIDAEVSVSRGRIDATLELRDKVYVFEFKYENCPNDADECTKRKIFEKTLEIGMKQINERGYADKYAGCGKTVYLAAFAFLGRSDVEMRHTVIQA